MSKKSLHGRNHFVSDVVISSDGQFALSGSWDNTRFKSGTLAREISTCVYVAQIDCRLHHCKLVFISLIIMVLDVEISPAQTTPHVITKI